MSIKVIWRNGKAHARGTVAGKLVRESLGTDDPRRAKQAAAEIETRIWKESIYGADAVVSFEDAAVSYMEAGGEGKFLARPLHHFKGVLLSSIKPGHVVDAARKLYPDAKPSTQRRQVIVPVVAVINHGHQRGWCASIKVEFDLGKTPTRKAVERDYIDALRTQCLTRSRRLPHLAALMLYLFQTGSRVGEAIDLRPEDVDLGKGEAIAYDTKNGEDRLVHLTPEMVEELRHLPVKNGRVFAYTKRNGIYAALKTVCEEAGLEYLGTHQAGRHSFATALDDMGFTASAIAAAGGWKSVALVQKTYIHPKDAGKRAAAAMSTRTATSTK